MNPKRRTPYDAFFEILSLVLLTMEAKHGFPGKAASAYWRLLVPEVLGGNTGFVNNNDPAQAASEYAAHVYENEPPPFWMTSNQL